MNPFDWNTTQEEHHNRYPPMELTPAQEKHNRKFCMNLVLEDVRKRNKAAKRKARRAAQKTLKDAPK